MLSHDAEAERPSVNRLRSGGCGCLAEVPFEHLLDAWRARAALDPRDQLPLPDEDERRRRGDSEPLRHVASFVDVDLHNAQAMPLLTRDVREEALHATRRPGTGRREEEEKGAGVSVAWQSADPVFPLLLDPQTRTDH
jgi:hypothetical protein